MPATASMAAATRDMRPAASVSRAKAARTGK